MKALKRIITLGAAAILVLGLAVTALAEPVSETIPFEPAESGDVTFTLRTYGETYDYCADVTIEGVDGVYRGTFSTPYTVEGSARDVTYTGFVVYHCPGEAKLREGETFIIDHEDVYAGVMGPGTFTRFVYSGGELQPTSSREGSVDVDSAASISRTLRDGLYALDTFALDELRVGDKDGTGHVVLKAPPTELDDDPDSATLYLVAAGEYDVEPGTVPFEDVDMYDVTVPMRGEINDINENTVTESGEFKFFVGERGVHWKVNTPENAYLHISHVTGYYKRESQNSAFEVYRVPADAEFWIEAPDYAGEEFAIDTYTAYEDQRMTGCTLDVAAVNEGDRFTSPAGNVFWQAGWERSTGILEPMSGMEITDTVVSEYIYVDGLPEAPEAGTPEAPDDAAPSDTPEAGSPADTPETPDTQAPSEGAGAEDEENPARDDGGSEGLSGVAIAAITGVTAAVLGAGAVVITGRKRKK